LGIITAKILLPKTDFSSRCT